MCRKMHPAETRHDRTRSRRAIICERVDLLKVFGSVILTALLLAGCASTTNQTLASGNNLELNYTPPRQHLTGESCASNFFGIPTRDNDPSVQQAVDNAASMSPGTEMMTDMTIHRDLFVTFAYNQACVRVDGTGIRQSSGSRYLDTVRRDFDWND
jgi:hypothetical protein